MLGHVPRPTMEMRMTADPLDNPVWHALTGPHARIATGRGAARHYPRDVAPFSAIAEPTAAAYADLAADLPAGLEARLFRPQEEPAPPGWENISHRPIVQMVLDHPDLLPPQAGDAEAVPLGSADAAGMLALAEAAKPGPFAARTVELGGYIGVRDASGRLVAMGGERLCLASHVELSAIAVHPDHRKHGLGRAITARLAHAVLARGQVPFLHVFPDNPAAALYARLGFRERARLFVVWRRPITAGTRS